MHTSGMDPVYRVASITPQNLENIRKMRWDKRELKTVNGINYVSMVMDDIRVRLYAHRDRGVVIDGCEKDVETVMLMVNDITKT